MGVLLFASLLMSDHICTPAICIFCVHFDQHARYEMNCYCLKPNKEVLIDSPKNQGFFMPAVIHDYVHTTCSAGFVGGWSTLFGFSTCTSMIQLFFPKKLFIF